MFSHCLPVLVVSDESLTVNPDTGDHEYTISPFSLALLRFSVSSSFYYDVSMCRFL